MFVIILMTVFNYIKYKNKIINDKFIQNLKQLKKDGKVYKAEIINVYGNDIRYKFVDDNDKEHFGMSTLILSHNDLNKVNVYCNKDDYTNNCSEYTILEVENQIGMTNCLFLLCGCFEILLLYILW